MMKRLLLAALVLGGCSTPPPPPRTWSHSSNPISVTGPASVAPGRSHVFEVTCTGEPKRQFPLSVHLFGDGKVEKLSEVPSGADYKLFQAGNVTYDDSGKYVTNLTVTVGQEKFVPLFSLQTGKTVPLGLLIEVHDGEKAQSVEVNALGVPNYRPR